jgi:hypothetical protein
MRPLLHILYLVLLSWVPVNAREVQSHGLLFEKWVRDTFFEGYTPKGYTQRWDIPAEMNKEHGGIPVNPKAIKYGTPVDLGDAIRQFEIIERGETFMLIVGFWEQITPTEKRWVQSQAVTVTPDQWRKLWQPVTKPDLEKLVAVIKDKSLTLDEARAKAKAIKGSAPFTESVMEVNPKIDGSQRRLQCSIGFKDFFKHLAPGADPTKQEHPKIFGVAVPLSFSSSPREIGK